MNYDCRAISIINHKYGEGSIIAKIFTEDYGLKSFNIKRGRSKKTKNKISLLEKLSLLNISAKHQANKELQYITEISVAHHFQSTGLYNKLLRIFMAEILSKILIEGERNPSVFNFIWRLTKDLDNEQEIDHNFSLRYLISLTKFLGFFPSIENIEYQFFNLNNSCFTNKTESSEEVINGDNLNYFRALITNRNINIPYKNRQQLIEKIFYYYKVHHYKLDNIKSHIVIESLR